MKRASLFVFCVVVVALTYVASANPYGATVSVVAEAFTTSRNEGDNIDSPAVWHGPEGQHWILATAKWSDQIVVFEAASGVELKRVGESGDGPGQFKRPNSLAVVGNSLFVVERDNARVQVLSLPQFAHVAFFGTELLRRPYGVTVARTPASKGTGSASQRSDLNLYVTDNYALESGLSLNERVKRFRIRWEGEGLVSEYAGAFGDTVGAGALHKVESLAADAEGGRLLIADEAQVDIKVYGLDGQFSGLVVGSGLLRSEPEGIALMDCGGGRGYWIATDQSPTDNVFHVLDRQTLDLAGSFSGKTTRRTDGIAITTTPFGPFPGGAFYAADDDVRLAAFDWQDVAAATGLDAACSGD